MFDYRNFYSEYVALSLLAKGDKNAHDITLTIAQSVKRDYLDTLFIFGALDGLIKDKKVSKYNIKDASDLTDIMYHITSRGSFHLRHMHVIFMEIQQDLGSYYK